MGILTNLLKTAWDQENSRRDAEINRYQTIATLPNIQPEIQSWAIGELTKLAPKKAGGIKDIGEMFKGLIGKQKQDMGPQQRYNEALASTGRPSVSGLVQGAAAPTEATSAGGTPLLAGGQRQPNIPMNIPGVAPSATMTPQDMLAQKLDEVRKRGQVENDLRLRMQDFLDEKQLNQEAKAEKARFQRTQDQIKSLMAPGPDGKPLYTQSEAIGIVTGHYPPATRTSTLARPILGSDPELAKLGADPKKSYIVIRGDDGKIVTFFETAAATGADDNKLTAKVKSAIQSVKLAHPGWDDDKVKRFAGNLLEKDLSLGVSKKELDELVNLQLAESAGVIPSKGEAPSAAPRPGPAQSVRIGGVETAPIKPGSDEDLMNQYLSQLLNPIPGARGDKFANVAYRRGRSILMARTGMGPTQIDAAIRARHGTATALQNAMQMQGAFERLQNSLTSFGDILTTARSKVNDTGVTVLNRWLQAGMRAVPGDEDVGRLDVAVNAVARTYAQVLAGGYQSKAMPPVSSTEEARNVIAGEMQEVRIGAIIGQMKLEADAEKKAMTKQQQDLYDELAKPFTEARPGGGATPVPGTPGPTPGPAATTKPKTAAEFMAAH